MADRRYALIGHSHYPQTAAESSAGVTPTNYQYEPGNVLRYGTNTTGTTDMTTAIQAALNSGHKAFGTKGDTYLISQQSTKTINSVVTYYCLEIDDNTEFDGNGCTIKLADSENASLFINADAGTSENSEITLKNFIIDGNQANQTSPSTGEMACIKLHDVDRAHVENIKVTNARDYAGRFLGCTNSYFNNLHCTDSDGDGWSFGASANSEQCVECFVDNIFAESCLGTYAGLVGNPFIGVLQDSSIGKVIGKNSAGGIKIQDDSRNLNIQSLEFFGSTSGTGNSGVKIQGNSGAGVYPRGINVATINCRGCWGTGLYINSIHSVVIGSYVGRNNGGGGGTGSEEYDVDIATGTSSGPESVQIGTIYSEANGDTIAIRVGSGIESFQCDQITLYNPTDIGVQIETSGRVNIGSIHHIDDAVTPTTTYVLKITGDCEGHIGLVSTNLAHSTSQSRVDINSGLYNISIGSIILGSTDPIEGVVALTGSSTTTAVTCGHIWRDYQGGSADYLHPIIQVVPIDSTSAALGNMRCTVTNGSSGTGFTINHASATTGDDVFWKVLCWKVISKAVA